MKKFILLGLALLMVVVFTITAFATDQQKVDLLDNDDNVSGWVIANKNDSGEIILEIHVQKVADGTLFYVFIKDDFWNWTNDECRNGKFITNKVGNGNLHLTIPSTGVTLIDTVIVREPYDIWRAGGERYFTASWSFSE